MQIFVTFLNFKVFSYFIFILVNFKNDIGRF